MIMSIKILQETTDWGEQNIPNGIYHINEKGWLVAHENDYGLTTFSKPMKQFSKSRRTFKQIGEYSD